MNKSNNHTFHNRRIISPPKPHHPSPRITMKSFNGVQSKWRACRFHESNDVENSDHNAMQQVAKVTASKNYGEFNSNSIKTSEVLNSPNVLPKKSSSVIYDLNEIPNIPSPIFFYFELLFCLTKEIEGYLKIPEREFILRMMISHSRLGWNLYSTCLEKQSLKW